MAGAHPDIPGLAGWRPLARGGFATVWEAKQESLNRLVAVKVDQRTLDTEPEQRRFLREAGAAGRMSGYPGIVTVHDAGILSDNRPYLVMQLCTGGSLTVWVKGDERPSQERVREVGVRVADALAAAHARGVLHRDVKPANILIDDYGTAGLADFGLAALPDHGLEHDGLEAITPAYAPPEFFDRRTPTEFSDVYSLAATLYALLAGHPPRWPYPQPPTVADMLHRLSQPIERIHEVNRPFMDLLLSALADEPTDRPTAAQFRDRLWDLDLTPLPPPSETQPEDPRGVVAEVADRKPAVPVPAAMQPPGSPSRRRGLRAFVALLVALLVVGLVSAVLVLRPFNTTTGAPPPATTLPVPSTPPATPTPAEPTPPAPTPPTPTQVAVPAGFVDCAEPLGAGKFCADEYECYGSVGVYGEGLMAGVEADCDQTHVYQTFAAGHLGYNVARQETLDKDELRKELCTPVVANLMLRRKDQRDDWEIIALGPQNDGEDFFRCIFGRGERARPFELVPP